MSEWVPRVVVLAATLAMVLIRAPHGRRNRDVKVRLVQRPFSERAVLPMCFATFFGTLIWVAAPSLLRFADRPLDPALFAAGVALYIPGLWLFYRSHADLGTNWSATLKVREHHTLVTQGCYRSIRHPMYTALLLYSLGQALVIPNWLAGPAYLAAIGALIALRLHREERLMLDEFGEQYRQYAAHTKRLIPGVW